MDPEVVQILGFVTRLLPFIAIIVVTSIGGSLLHTWLKIKNGYPLSNSWGMPLHPKKDEETVERVRLITTENAQLRAELGIRKVRGHLQDGRHATRGWRGPSRKNGRSVG